LHPNRILWSIFLGQNGIWHDIKQFVLLSFRTWELSSWNKSTEINHPICIITCRSMCAKASNVLSSIWRQTKKWNNSSFGVLVLVVVVTVLVLEMLLFLIPVYLYICRGVSCLLCIMLCNCRVFFLTRAMYLSPRHTSHTCTHKKHSFCCIQMIYNVGCTLRSLW